MVQGAIEGQVVGVTRGCAGGGTCGEEDGVHSLTPPRPGSFDSELPSWRVHIGMVPTAHPQMWCFPRKCGWLGLELPKRSTDVPNLTLWVLENAAPAAPPRPWWRLSCLGKLLWAGPITLPGVAWAAPSSPSTLMAHLGHGSHRYHPVGHRTPGPYTSRAGSEFCCCFHRRTTLCSLACTTTPLPGKTAGKEEKVFFFALFCFFPDLTPELTRAVQITGLIVGRHPLFLKLRDSLQKLGIHSFFQSLHHFWVCSSFQPKLIYPRPGVAAHACDRSTSGGQGGWIT